MTRAHSDRCNVPEGWSDRRYGQIDAPYLRSWLQGTCGSYGGEEPQHCRDGSSAGVGYTFSTAGSKPRSLPGARARGWSLPIAPLISGVGHALQKFQYPSKEFAKLSTMKEIDQHFHDQKEGEFVSIFDLGRLLWSNWRIIALSTFVAACGAAIYAFKFAPVVYESSAILLPVQSSSDQLGAAAALLGKKMSGSADVELYQNLLTSRSVILTLLKTAVENKSDTGKGKSEPLLKILAVDPMNQEEMEDIRNSLAGCITVGSKSPGSGGIIEVKFIAGSAWLAQEIGIKVLEIGQAELQAIRKQRSQIILDKLNNAVEIAKSQWNESAVAVASFRDRNRSIATPDQLLVFSRLEIEKQVQEQKYLLTRKEYEVQNLEMEKNVPAIMILDLPNYPSRPIKPRRPLILLIGLLTGLFGSCLGIIGWKLIRNDFETLE